MMGLIQFYRSWISPMTPPSCRFQPTCSEYAYQAIERYGAVRGGLMGLRRILRCHPWGGSGWDPVPLPEGDSNAAGPERVGTDGEQI